MNPYSDDKVGSSTMSSYSGNKVKGDIVNPSDQTLDEWVSPTTSRRTSPKGRSSTKGGSSTNGGPSTMNSHSDGKVGSSAVEK